MRIAPLLAALGIAAATTAPSLADAIPGYPWMMPGQPMNIAVQATGEVEYTPDVAQLTLGVNTEASSAAAATANIAERANAVISALKGLGIPASGIKTSGYNLYYREASENVRAAFVASESLNVKTSVDKAGAAIDAGIRAGANQTYGLGYDTSQREALYKEAVQRAVMQAHDLAQAAASAAGVKLGPVLSINIPGTNPQPIYAPMPMMRMSMAAPAPPPIAPGTGTLSATVTASYAIANPGPPTPMPMRPLHP